MKSLRIPLAFALALIMVGCSNSKTSLPILDRPLGGPSHFVSQANRHGNFVKFRVPTLSSGLIAIAAGPDGNMWFTEDRADKIGRISMSGAITEFPLPTSNAGPLAITAGPDGNMWFAEAFYNGKIGRISTGGQITEFPLPSALGYACAAQITAGPDGAVWFGDPCNDGIGRVTTDGVFSPLVPTTGPPSGKFTSGPDGNVWFTEPSNGIVGKITPAGVLTEYTPPTQDSAPAGITEGGDGNMWFLEGNGGGKYGRITTSGVIKEFLGDGDADGGTVMVEGPPDFRPTEKILFATEQGENAIELFSVRKKAVIGEANLPNPGSNGSLNWIALGPDGNMWFTLEAKNEIGVYVINKMSVVPTSLTLQVGQVSSVTVSEQHYTGAWTAASSNDNVATVAPGPPSVFNVTGVSTGTCTVTISDSMENSVPVVVTVQ